MTTSRGTGGIYTEVTRVLTTYGVTGEETSRVRHLEPP